jgi:hypothetical protein
VGEEEKKEQWERNMTIGVTISTKNHQKITNIPNTVTS